MTSRDEARTDALQEHVDRVVAEAPPLTNEQRHQLAQLLAPNVVVGGGGSHG